MPAYLIGQVMVHDSAEYNQYMAGFMDAFAPFGGRILVATEDAEVLEGEWPRARTVVLEFPSLAQAKSWYQSPKYQAIMQHRLRGAKSSLVLANGFEPPKA